MDVHWMVVAGGGVVVVLAVVVGVVIGRRRTDRAAAPTRPRSPTIAALDNLVADSLGLLVSRIGASRPDLRSLIGPDGSVTLLFSDITGSTALNLELGDREWSRVVKAHDDAVGRLVRAHGGQVVKTQGDGFMAAFSEAEPAVRCAVALRAAFTDADTAGIALRLRVGIHTGEVVSRQGDYFGANVVLAARLADRARGDEILVSRAVRDRVEDAAGDLAFGRRPGMRLKGLPGRHPLYRVRVATGTG